MRDFALLILEERGLLVLAGILLVQVVVVVAGVFVERAAAELENAVAEGIEELAIVGNDDEAAGIAREVVLKPEQRLEVEMVGRLVEHEQSGLADEEAGKVRAHDPTAREGFGLLVVVGLAKAEAGENFFGARLKRPVDVVVVVVLRHQFFAARGNREDGFVADGCAFLREIAEVRAALPFDRAIVG